MYRAEEPKSNVVVVVSCPDAESSEFTPSRCGSWWDLYQPDDEFPIHLSWMHQQRFQSSNT